jgi:hypothetical protein
MTDHVQQAVNSQTFRHGAICSLGLLTNLTRMAPYEKFNLELLLEHFLGGRSMIFDYGLPCNLSLG